MSKKIKRLKDIRDIPITPRKLLLWLLYLLTILKLQQPATIGALAQTCSNLKFPLTFGFTSGETEIISIDHEYSTGNLYISGTTTAIELLASGATKSVFTAMFNGIEYAWIKVINSI